MLLCGQWECPQVDAVCQRLRATLRRICLDCEIHLGENHLRRIPERQLGHGAYLRHREAPPAAI